MKTANDNDWTSYYVCDDDLNEIFPYEETNCKLLDPDMSIDENLNDERKPYDNKFGRSVQSPEPNNNNENSGELTLSQSQQDYVNISTNTGDSDCNKSTEVNRVKIS